MNTKAGKLARKLGDKELAQELVKAGLDNPAKLRAASDKAIRDVVGPSKLAQVRGKFRQREG